MASSGTSGAAGDVKQVRDDVRLMTRAENERGYAESAQNHRCDAAAAG